MQNLIIRRDKRKDLILSRSVEGVYFLFRFGNMVFNSINYDKVSDEFNNIMKEG